MTDKMWRQYSFGLFIYFFERATRETVSSRQPSSTHVGMIIILLHNYMVWYLRKLVASRALQCPM